MKREVVQDFLNLPGITGVALMDGRSRPCFYGIDRMLNFQQKEALAQGIQQVVETTPPGFEFFEFQFTGHQVYIYKLEHGIILLVLTNGELVYADYSKLVDQLKLGLKEDAANAIATFWLLAGNITLSNQNYWKHRTEVDSTAKPNNSYPSANPSQFNPTLDNPIQPRSTVSDRNGNSPLPTPHSPLPTPHSQTDVSIKELLLALNYLSQFTIQYLGTTVVTNYWKSTRPPIDWLNNFQIDRSAQITLSGDSSNSPEFLTAEQHQWVRDWTAAFIQRCSKVIRDFLTIIEQRALDERQKSFLLSDRN
jgi:hypothetical protein